MRYLIHRAAYLALAGVLALGTGGGCTPAGEQIELKPVSGPSRNIPYWTARQPTLRSLHVASEDRAWAVGHNGTILSYRDGGWTRDPEANALTNSALYAVWSSKSNDIGWAVGENGTILRLRDETWSVDEASQHVTDMDLFAVWFADGGDTGWAMGRAGTVLRYRAGAWSLDQKASNTTLSILTSIWMNSNGDMGWAVGTDGTILRYRNRAWAFDATASAVTDRLLRSIWMDEDGNSGWAVGRNGMILRYQDGAWSLDRAADVTTDEDLFSVWMSETADTGWAVGRNGAILRYRDGSWSIDPASGTETRELLVAVWTSRSGDTGWVIGNGTILRWAHGTWSHDLPKVGVSIWISHDGHAGWGVGDNGTILRYRDGLWQIDSASGVATDAELSAVGASKSAQEAWAVGENGIFLRFHNGAWSLDEAASALTDAYLTSVWISESGDRGWAVGEGGTLLAYRSGVWSLDPASGHVTSESLLSVDFSKSGDVGWAVGMDGTFLRYRNGAWELEPEGTVETWIHLTSVWLSDTGNEGWAVGEEGAILRYRDGAWSVEPAEDLPDETLWSVTSSESGGRAWAVGEGGTFLRYEKGTWSVDEAASRKTKNDLWSVWVSTSGDEGWAMGTSGTILQGASLPIRGGYIEPHDSARLQELAGTFRLVLDVPPTSGPSTIPPDLELLDDRGVDQLSKADYEIRLSQSNPIEYLVTFKAQGLAERLKHREHRLRIHTLFVKPSETEIVLTTDGFYIVGRPLWQKGVALAGAVLVFNLFLFLLAVPITWIRTVVLHPAGSNAVGLVFGKYLLTDWLIRFVHPLKLAMFRDYRKQLGESSPIRSWEQRLYVPPDVSLEEDAVAVETPNAEDQWRALFRHLLAAPRRRLWLVLGESGLGKTTLLEQWTGLALSQGKTPFLIRLGSDLRPEEEAASLMAQYGDVNVNAKTAMDLLTGGGFLVFLDGFNEDRTPDATREFVRQVSKRNLVVMTSQLDPRWDRMVDVHRIRLEAFGTDQLSELLGAEWTKKVLESPHLAGEARLPMTAKLLAAFVESKGKLPGYGLQVYQELREALQGSELFNLDAQAWELFKANRDEFEPGDGLPPEFCDRAVDHGVLTRRSRDGQPRYRFVHERIQRYFVAAYLHRQGGQTVYRAYEEAEKVRRDLGKERWRVAFEFWGEMIARGVPGGRGGDTAYREFLREVAEFDAAIFAQALYPQYDRLCTSGLLTPDEEFVRWAARFMAEAAR